MMKILPVIAMVLEDRMQKFPEFDLSFFENLWLVSTLFATQSEAKTSNIPHLTSEFLFNSLYREIVGCDLNRNQPLCLKF